MVFSIIIMRSDEPFYVNTCYNMRFQLQSDFFIQSYNKVKLFCNQISLNRIFTFLINNYELWDPQVHTKKYTSKFSKEWLNRVNFEIKFLFKFKQMNMWQNVLSAMCSLTLVVWKCLLWKAIARVKNTRSLFKSSWVSKIPVFLPYQARWTYWSNVSDGSDLCNPRFLNVLITEKRFLDAIF